MSVTAIVEVIASAIEIAVWATAFATLVTEVIGQRQTDRTAVPSILAELPEPFAPSGVSSCTAIQYITHIKRQSQLFIEEGVSQTDIDGVTVTCRTLCYHARGTVSSRQLSAEILGEEELRIHAYRTGEDILFGQIDRY